VEGTCRLLLSSWFGLRKNLPPTFRCRTRMRVPGPRSFFGVRPCWVPSFLILIEDPFTSSPVPVPSPSSARRAFVGADAVLATQSVPARPILPFLGGLSAVPSDRGRNSNCFPTFSVWRGASPTPWCVRTHPELVQLFFKTLF